MIKNRNRRGEGEREHRVVAVLPNEKEARKPDHREDYREDYGIDLPSGFALVRPEKLRVSLQEQARSMELFQAIGLLLTHEDRYKLQDAFDAGLILVRITDPPMSRPDAEQERYRRYVEQDLTLREMSNREGCSVSTVKRRLTRYRARDPFFGKKDN